MAEIKKDDIIQSEEIKKAFADILAATTAVTKQITAMTEESIKLSAALKSGGITDLNKATKEYQATLQAQIKTEQELQKLEKLKANTQQAATKAAEAEAKAQAAATRENEKAAKAAEKQAKALAQETSAYSKQSKALTEARNRAKDLAVQYGTNSKAFRDAAKEVSKLDKELKNIDAKLGQHQRNVGNYASGWKKLGLGLMGAFGIQAGLSGLVSGFQAAFKKSVEFEKGLSSLSSITGLAGKQLKELGKMARNMSKTYGIAAVDTLKAMELIGSAKPELLENAAALADVTEKSIVLAQAAGMELPDAAASLTNIMNQMSIGAEGAANAINVLAAGSKAGAAPITYLAQAIEKSGTTASMMGMSVEQLTGAIESIAPYYSKAEMAGNSFDKVLLKLKERQIGYKDGVFDLNSAIDELRGMYAKGTTAADLFGVEHSKMGELLVKNQKSFNDLTKAVTGTNTAYEQAAINTDNYAGASARLAAKWDDLMLSFGNTKFATGLINSLSSALDTLAYSMMNAAEIADKKSGEMYQNLYPKDAVTNEEKIKGLKNLLLSTEDQIAELTDANIRANEQMGIWEKAKMGIYQGLTLGLGETELQNEINSTYKRITVLQALYDKVDAELANLRALPTGDKVDGGKQLSDVGSGSTVVSDVRKPTTDLMPELKSKEAAIEQHQANLIEISRNGLATESSLTKEYEQLKTDIVSEEEEKRRQIREQAQDLAFDAMMQGTDLFFENQAVARDNAAAAELAAIDERLNNEKLDDEQRAELQKQRDKKERKIKRDAAKADKENALFQIGINTAIAVMKAYAQLGPIAGTVAAPMILAGGAVQAAFVAARKLPEYFRGTDNHPGGAAIVGDGGGGRELVIEPSGKQYLTPATDTIMDLPKGTKVIPGSEVANKLTDMTRAEMVQLSLNMPKDNAQNDYIAALMAKQIAKSDELIKAVKSQKPVDIRPAVAFEVQKMKLKNR